MEFIQIFDRNANAWTKRFRPFVGFVENFVQDKTTDSATGIQFKVYQIEEPAWDIGDWVRIMHVADKDEAASYTDEGLPINHNQYIISEIKSDWNGRNGYWLVSLVLSEPIERAHWILGETLSYTNTTEKVTDGVTYYKDAYNCYTALERWLMVTPANCDNYTPGYDRASNISWFNRLRVLDERWLQTIEFNDDTLNELTLYDFLMNILDSTTGRTPVMYFDMNTDTDLPNNPARDEYLLKFERQDGFDKPVIEYDEIARKAFSITLSKSAANKATGLVTNAENLSSGEGINYPAIGLYAVPEVDADVRDTTGYNEAGTDNWVLRLQHPIKRIIKLDVLVLRGRKAIATGEVTEVYSRIAHRINFVYEKKQYLALENDPTNKVNLYWFEEGSNLIHIKEYSYKPNDTSFGSAYLYYIEYEPLINSRLWLGDAEYVQQVNQSASQIDSKKYADFLNQMLDGMNKADITIGKTYNSYNSFKDLIGSRVQRGSKEYLITNISYRNRNYQYDAVFQLNENHFRKNNSYRASQQIQKNTAIEYSNLKDRKIAIKQITRIGLTPQTHVGYQFTVFGVLLPLSALIPGFFAESAYPQLAGIELNYRAKTQNGILFPSKFLVANIAGYSFGNQIYFNVQFFDNADAGKIKIRTEEESRRLLQSKTNFTRVEQQIPIIYTDSFGEVETITIYLSNLEIIKEASGNTTEIYNENLRIYDSILKLPTISDEDRQYIQNNASAIVPKQIIKKDELEILNNSIIFEIQSEDIIVCDALTKYSRLLSIEDMHTLELAFYKEHHAKYDSLDNQIGSVDISNPTITDSFRFDYNFETEEDINCVILFAVFADKREPLLMINIEDEAIKESIKTNLVIYSA